MTGLQTNRYYHYCSSVGGYDEVTIMGSCMMQNLQLISCLTIKKYHNLFIWKITYGTKSHQWQINKTICANNNQFALRRCFFRLHQIVILGYFADLIISYQLKTEWEILENTRTRSKEGIFHFFRSHFNRVIRSLLNCF